MARILPHFIATYNGVCKKLINIYQQDVKKLLQNQQATTTSKIKTETNTKPTK
jgi:hypothetical protein